MCLSEHLLKVVIHETPFMRQERRKRKEVSLDEQTCSHSSIVAQNDNEISDCSLSVLPISKDNIAITSQSRHMLAYFSLPVVDRNAENLKTEEKVLPFCWLCVEFLEYLRRCFIGWDECFTSIDFFSQSWQQDHLSTSLSQKRSVFPLWVWKLFFHLSPMNWTLSYCWWSTLNWHELIDSVERVFQNVF